MKKTGVTTPVFIFCIRMILLIFVLAPGKTAAQNLTKYYVALYQSDGVLYFVLPQTNFNNPQTKNDFIMDVTCHNSKDSATVNFTYYDRENFNPETIAITYNDWKYHAPVKRIYTDMEKGLWRYRYTFNIPFEQLSLFYKAKSPDITITTDLSRSIPVKTTKQWEKNADVNNKIIQIIQKNRVNQ